MLNSFDIESEPEQKDRNTELETVDFKKITKTECSTVLFRLMLTLPILLYLTYACSTISPDLVNETTTRMFLMFIITLWIEYPLMLLEYRDMLKYIGLTFNVKLYPHILSENHLPLCILKIQRIPRYIACMYFIFTFIPVSGQNCDIYPNGSHICIILQSLTICICAILILFGVYLIFILFIAMYVLYLYCKGNVYYYDCGTITTITQSGRNSYSFPWLHNLKFLLLPLFTKKLDTNTTCVICAKPKNELTQKNLDCGHSFDDECIEMWYRRYQTVRCPLCKN